MPGSQADRATVGAIGFLLALMLGIVLVSALCGKTLPGQENVPRGRAAWSQPPPKPPVPPVPPEEILQPPRKHLIRTSWYGPGFHGRLTASGVPYDMHKPTAAHRTLPFGTKLRLKNPRNGRKLDVCITDRGPYAQFDGVTYFKDKRDLDVSWHAARELGFEHVGVEWLTYRILRESCRASAQKQD